MEGQTVIAPDVDPGLDLDPDPGFDLDLDLDLDLGFDPVPDLGFDPDPDLGPGIGLYPDLYLVQVFVPGIDPYPVPVPDLGLGQMFDPVLAQYL